MAVSHWHGRTLAATVSTSNLKPSHWTDALRQEREFKSNYEEYISEIKSTYE
jgi:hypothetical protein